MVILDILGQEEYRALHQQWIREGDGFLIVYAINSEESFDETAIIRSNIKRFLELEDNDNYLKFQLC